MTNINVYLSKHKKVQWIEGKSGESFPAEIVTFLFQFEVTPIILSQLHLSLYSSAKATVEQRVRTWDAQKLFNGKALQDP